MNVSYQKSKELQMEPFVTLNGVVAPMNRVNVDTDQIIPKQASSCSSTGGTTRTGRTTLNSF
jgi:hypothetical protein